MDSKEDPIRSRNNEWGKHQEEPVDKFWVSGTFHQALCPGELTADKNFSDCVTGTDPHYDFP